MLTAAPVTATEPHLPEVAADSKRPILRDTIRRNSAKGLNACHRMRGIDHRPEVLKCLVRAFDYPSIRGASRAYSGFRQADFGHRQIQIAGSFQMGDGWGLP